ncbi:ferrochelatase [Tenacibaculum maritimum]|uniref:ferrochelatase n=1 Tax=Tenacibaculum maritimum TaxID=107401 RepID=UPI0012E5D9DA|nr:ferrochelatase [Tenacibaculum maritimum]MCD9581568.1 ferrochelatase [Tenacibaculum maritimum]MCD9636008.1 ferrochelatase [Tenacibaculum maritimum]CAA0172740.1 Ferrochelatase [Tenacibaculum maritimum]CAA0189997.1 Ferrochelatase [Tenacibaculum maritimum]CAA0202488.1 Ferrochelatase [Tenacibaculum maritimum]
MKGILLINLGSPDSTQVKDVRKYLDEFLMDERVIDIPYWKRFLLIKGIILRTRPKKSAEAYKKIWWKEGSPLVVISERFTKKVANNTEMPVALAMRYGSNNIEKGFKELVNKGVNDILMVPLYPHYAMSSTETVEVKAEEVRATYYPHVKTEVLPSFYNHPDYIKVMSDNLKKNLEDFDYDHILFSYHGIPERHILKSDPTKQHCKIDGSCCETASVAHKTCYRHQCFETTKEIAKKLGLKESNYSNSFQSRLLKDPWLKPYTDFELERLPKEEGKKNLAVITPAFVADCLETLEEIAMEGKEEFMENGGETYKHIPCMNDNDDWVAVMNKWIDTWAAK